MANTSDVEVYGMMQTDTTKSYKRLFWESACSGSKSFSGQPED